jgi:hypothetical protein
VGRGCVGWGEFDVAGDVEVGGDAGGGAGRGIAAGEQTSEETGESEGGYFQKATGGATGRGGRHELGSKALQLREEYEGAPKATITPLGDAGFFLVYRRVGGWALGGGADGDWAGILKNKGLLVQLLAIIYIRIVDTK